LAASDAPAAVERQSRSGQIAWYRGERRPRHGIFRQQELFVATDRRFPGSSDKVGLWTQADSLTLFENLNIGSLELKS
jgi:hypothetical protein